MRLRACIGLLLAAVGGCAHIPDHIRVDIDGHTVEVVKAPLADDEERPEPDNEW
jgi:hypothetical protein